MSGVKEKYLKFDWHGYSIIKVYACEKDDSEFFVYDYDGDILKLMNSVRGKKLRFEIKGAYIYLIEKENQHDTLSLKIEYDRNGNMVFVSSDKNNIVPIYKNTKNKPTNSFNIFREVLKLFEIKRIERNVKKSLKNQLSILNYQPGKIKKMYSGENNVSLRVPTNVGHLNVTYCYKNKLYTFESIDFNKKNYKSEETIEEEIFSLKQRIDFLEKMKECLNDVNFEVNNMV